MITNLSREDLYLNPGADIILATVYNPGDRRNNKHNTKCGDTVVYLLVSHSRFHGMESVHTHVAASSRQFWREEEEDSGEGNVDQRNLA